MSRNVILTYNDLITLQDGDDDSITSGVRVKGVAFRSGVIANKGVFIPDGELENVTRTLEGAPFLIDHSHSIRDVCGSVTSAWQENSLVKFKGEIVDEEIAEKIRRGLVNSVSVGLHVQDIENIALDGQALKKLNGITVKELSLVLFPAVEGATFEPSFEFSIEVEADENHPVDVQLTEVDFLAMEELIVAKGKMVVDRADFEAIQYELAEKRAEYERISKQLWMLSTCDETFNANTIDKIGSLSLDQIQFLWEAYRDLQTRTEGSRGIAYDEKDQPSMANAREDIRELIFGQRRDKVKLGKVKDIRDIKI